MKLFKNKKNTPRKSSVDTTINRNNFVYYSSRRTQPNKKSNAETIKTLVSSNITISLCLFIILLSLVYAMSLSSNIKFSINPSEASIYREKPEYQKYIEEQIKGSLAYSFKPTFSKTQLSSNIIKHFPEVKDIGITIPILGRKPIIDLEIYKPSYAITQNNRIYIGNEKGVLLASGISGLNSSGLLTITDNSQVVDKIGSAPLSATDLEFINEVVLQLKEKGIMISNMVLPNIPNELHISLKDRDFYVKFALNGSARMQSGSLVATIHKLDQDRVVPTEYIDVRVEDKVFYK